MATTTNAYFPLLQLNAVLLMLLAVNLCQAQVYISSSGLAWSGSCSGCPSTAPCQLSLTSTVALAPCTLYFQGIIPPYTITASFTGNLTLSSVGSVSLGGDLLLTNPTGGIVFRDFTSNGDHGFVLTADRTYFESSSITFTDTSQIALVGSSLVTLKDTNISASNLILKCDNLLQGTWIEMSNMNIQTTVGVVETFAILAAGEPSVRIRDSHIDGLMFSTASLKHVVLENVVGTLSSYMFETAPTSVSISDCRLTSASELSWRASNSGITGTLNIVRSYLKNLALSSVVQSWVNLESSTFEVDSHYAPIIDFSQGYGSKINMTDVLLVSNSATGSATVMSTFRASSYPDPWNVTNLTYRSPSTIPRMRLTRGNYKVVSPEFVVPSLEVADADITFIAEANSMVTFSGDITTTASSTIIAYSSVPPLSFHQIHIGPNVAIAINSPATMIEYQVFDPAGKIQCSAPDCIGMASNIHINVTWNSTLPLPTLGQTYPFIDGKLAPPPFYSAAYMEFAVVGNFTSPVSSYSFLEVPCASHCVSANSGPCVSRWRCTCKSGFEGENCECPTGGCVPTVPTASIPVTTPIAIAPQEIPVAPTPIEANPNAPVASPIDSPSSTPSNPSNTPHTSPTYDAPDGSPVDSPHSSNPTSNPPPVVTPSSVTSNPPPTDSPVESPIDMGPTSVGNPVSVITPASSAHSLLPIIAPLILTVLITFVFFI